MVTGDAGGRRFLLDRIVFVGELRSHTSGSIYLEQVHQQRLTADVRRVRLQCSVHACFLYASMSLVK